MGIWRRRSQCKTNTKRFCQKSMLPNSFILAKIHSKSHSSIHSKAPFPEFINISALKQFVIILAYSISECSSQPHSTSMHVGWKFYWKHATLRWWTHSTTCLLGINKITQKLMFLQVWLAKWSGKGLLEWKQVGKIGSPFHKKLIKCLIIVKKKCMYESRKSEPNFGHILEIHDRLFPKVYDSMKN